MMDHKAIEGLSRFGVSARPVGGKEWPLLTHVASGRSYDLNEAVAWLRDYLNDPSMVEFMLYHMAKH